MDTITIEVKEVGGKKQLIFHGVMGDGEAELAHAVPVAASSGEKSGE